MGAIVGALAAMPVIHTFHPGLAAVPAATVAGRHRAPPIFMPSCPPCIIGQFIAPDPAPEPFFAGAWLVAR